MSPLDKELFCYRLVGNNDERVVHHPRLVDRPVDVGPFRELPPQTEPIQIMYPAHDGEQLGAGEPGLRSGPDLSP